MPVWAQAEDGRAITRLARADFHSTIGGHEAAVEGIRSPKDPLVLLLVFDLVGDLYRIDFARRTVAEFFSDLDDQWYVASLQAQDGLRVVADPTRDHERLTELLNGLSVSGFPGLLDSVSGAAAIAHSMLQDSNVRVAVLYLTDGGIEDYRGDYSSPVVNPSDNRDLSRRFRDRIVQEKIASLSDDLAQYVAPLFFVHLEERSDSLNVTYQNGIRQFAQISGGGAYFARTPADVPLMINSALDRIRQHYALTLKLPENARGPLRLTVGAEGAARLEHRETLTIEVKKRKGKR